jgi:putative membrane protein
MSYIAIKYLHIVAMMVLFATLVVQHLLLKADMHTDELKRLRRVDRLYGLSALIVLVAGGLLWFTVGKDASFYSSNPIFHIKVTLFFIAGGLSIYPTLFFARQAKQENSQVPIPKKIIMLVRIQLLILLLIPLLAVLMANGIGLKA